ncbi:MAG: elongation factor G [Planctomycetota bacterium]
MENTIHNVAIAGHGSCGKTTLIEALLHAAQATQRVGSVDAGTSILDHDDEERARKFSIDATPCFLEVAGQRVTLIDTPGYPDFLGNALDAFAAVEMAVIAVDATAGVRVNTRRTFNEAGKRGLARAFIITRMDAENADFDRVVAQIQEIFGAHCLPMFLPNASGPEFASVENTYGHDFTSTATAKALHQRIVEAVVECDEKLMERYLAEEPIDDEEVDRVFTQAMVAGTVVPILCCSALKKIGLRKTLDTLAKLAPGHDQGLSYPLVDREGQPVSANAIGGPADPLVARVWKIEIDPFVGKLAFARVLSGTMTPNMHVLNTTRDHKDRITTILRMQGKDPTSLERAVPGDIVALPKLETPHIGDTITDGAVRGRLVSIPHPVPMVKLAVEPKSRNDDTKMGEALNKLVEGDSCFRVERVPSTHELVIAGRSTLHLEVVLHRLSRRSHIEVNTHVPKTSYLESISGSAEAHHRHKKQTGGRGQFGDVHIRLEKASSPEVQLEFVNEVVGGAIPHNLIPAVEKGIREIMDQGILAGFHVTGCKVTLFDGSYHPVDSSEQAFKTAGREAFKTAFDEARPCLLEPIVNIEIHMPTQYLGDITSDLNSRRGRIQGMDQDGETQQVIRAQVPEAEVKTYSTELRSLTGGEASYSIEFSHYEQVPPNVQEQVLKSLRGQSAHSAH